MSALRDLIVGEAELDDEEGDESFDEETGEVRRSKTGTNGLNGVNGHYDDSSEEEEDDNDEEAARQVISRPPSVWFQYPANDFAFRGFRSGKVSL